MLLLRSPARSALPLMAVGICAMGIAGCSTSLKSAKVEQFDQISTGQVYYLPRVEFQVTVTRELTVCSVHFDPEPAAAVQWFAQQLDRVKLEEDDARKLRLLQQVLADPALAAGTQTAIAVAMALPPAGVQALVARGPGGTPKADDALILSYAGLVGGVPPPRLAVKIEASMVAQASPTSLPDTQHAYSLDYALMSSGLKSTDYTVEAYPSGVLKSVNVTIEDQTGQAIQSVLGGVAKLAAAAGGFPFPVAVQQAATVVPLQTYEAWKEEQLDRQNPCKPAIRLRLHERKTIEAATQTFAQRLLGARRKLEKLEHAEAKAASDSAQAKAALEEFDAKDPKRAGAEVAARKAEQDAKLAAKASKDAKAELTMLENEAEKAIAPLVALRKALSLSRTITVRPALNQPAQPIGGEEEALSAWLLPPAATEPPDGPRAAARSALYAEAAVYAPHVSTNGVDGPSPTGIFYRQPLKSILLVCKTEKCVNAGGLQTAHPDNIILNTPYDIPQLGALAVLPLSNGPFQNNALAASFSESGALTKVTYKSNAAMAKAAEVFESSADTVLKYKEAKRSEEKTKLETALAETEARKKLVEMQLALEKAQADLNDFRASNTKNAE